MPTESSPIPAARAAALPPLEPPGVTAGFQGLRVMPSSGLSVTAFQASSGVVVLPSSTRPCSRSRAVTGLSMSQSWFGSMQREPRSVGQPRVRNMSLMEAGTPSSHPMGLPSSQRASESLALSSAASASTRQ
ncbi:hypothetical protein GCM10029992_54990 [Glycomyces albus]